jgi:dTDP-4-amino-4,6-dideoxygalactose transaminase
MYFVHPQIKFINWPRIKLSLLKPLNLKKLEDRLSAYFPGKQLIFTDMGRSAFKIIIEKLNLQNSEILLPAYLCDIFDPILKKYNIEPVFLDIDPKTFHIKTDDIAKKITPNTKAILVCHTYGLPADIQKIREIVDKNIFIIEDCAHSFGAGTGNFGDVAFFSLYKQFPTLRGGMLVCPKDWKVSLPKTSFNFRDFISLLNCFPLFAFFFKKFGKNLAPRMIRKEKLPEPAEINRFSLKLFSAFLKDFEKSLPHRKRLALFFQEELKKLGFEVQEGRNNVFCYLSVLVPKSLEKKRDVVVQKLRKYRVFCTRIWHTPITLNQEEFPNTLEATKRIINFPLQNHYTEKDIRKIIISLKRVITNL